MSDGFAIEIELPESHRTLHAPPAERHQRLTDLLRRAGIPLNVRCGERGICRGCEVELTHGALIAHDLAGRVHADGRPVLVRACQCTLADTATVGLRIPARSLMGHTPQVVSRFTLNVPRAHNPLWQLVTLRAEELAGARDIGAAISHAVQQRLRTPHPVRCAPRSDARPAPPVAGGHLAVALAYDGQTWHVTVTPDEVTRHRVGAAVDIGTTTVVVLLVDLADGAILAEAAGFNRQMQFGDDVVTRIGLCAADPAMVHQLQAAILDTTLAPLLHEALRAAQRDAADLACVTIAANTTMLHLYAGVNPGPMGTAPFTPAFLEHRVLRQTFGPAPAPAAPPTDEHAAPAVHLLPSVAAYVGADVCAGVLASGLVYDDGPALLVDVGTNGEIVLKHEGRMLGCATAAGPAFEGSGLSCGVRAVNGAIGHLSFTTDPLTAQTEIIGDGVPVGLCGSAYVDFLARAHRVGLLNHRGRFQRDNLPAGAAALLVDAHPSRALRIATGAGGQPITISEADIARLLQAKAAIAAGILTLLSVCGVSPEDVQTLYLAGGFGSHVDPASAIGCGLLPGFRPEQVRVLGNSALAGAYLALLDSSALDELSAISRRIEIVELNRDPGFEQRYIRQLSLPR